MLSYSDRRDARNEARQISILDKCVVMVYKAEEWEVVKKEDREEYHKQSHPYAIFDCGWEINH